MQIEVNKGQDFRPITLTLTVESAEELDVLYAMSLSNITLPNLLNEQRGVPTTDSYAVLATLETAVRPLTTKKLVPHAIPKDLW